MLAWELGAGLGHCVNLLPIAAGLVSRGHEVTVVVRDLAAAGEVFGWLPVRLLQSPFYADRSTLQVRTPRTFAHILHNTCCASTPQIRLLAAAWRSIFELARPEVLVCEHAPLALLASRSLGIRRVVLGTGFFSPPDVAPLPDLRPWLPNVRENLRRDEQTVLNRINKFIREDGQVPLASLARLYAEVDDNMLLTFPELDHYGHRQTEVYWGVWSPAGGVSAIWPNRRGPRLFAYLKPSTADWKLEAILSILRSVEASSLVYVPGAKQDWIKQFSCDRIAVSDRRVNVRQVACECDLAVLNGNAGTATELLRAGVPLINIPVYLEQTVFSIRVAKSGAGSVVPPNRPDEFATSLSRMLEGSEHKKAAGDFCDKYSNYCAEAAIEQLLVRLDALAKSRVASVPPGRNLGRFGNCAPNDWRLSPTKSASFGD